MIMKKHILSTVFALLVMTAFALPPVLALADTSGLIPCGNNVQNKQVTDPCTYEDLITLVQTIIDFLIFKLAAPISALLFAYAGYLYLTNGGNESQIKQAHDIFLNVFWGFILALGAWLLVKFFLDFLIGDTSNFNFLG